jgi:imidazoleglycerol phosphate synthase glutamine amidotransferase subunit HisH
VEADAAAVEAVDAAVDSVVDAAADSVDAAAVSVAADAAAAAAEAVVLPGVGAYPGVKRRYPSTPIFYRRASPCRLRPMALRR